MRLTVHELACARRRRTRSPRPGLVEVTRVHPVAWRIALALAEGDTRRLRVESRSAVLVINKPRPQ